MPQLASPGATIKVLHDTTKSPMLQLRSQSSHVSKEIIKTVTTCVQILGQLLRLAVNGESCFTIKLLDLKIPPRNDANLQGTSSHHVARMWFPQKRRNRVIKNTNLSLTPVFKDPVFPHRMFSHTCLFSAHPSDIKVN